MPKLRLEEWESGASAAAVVLLLAATLLLVVGWHAAGYAALAGFGVSLAVGLALTREGT